MMEWVKIMAPAKMIVRVGKRRDKSKIRLIRLRQMVMVVRQMVIMLRQMVMTNWQTTY